MASMLNKAMKPILKSESSLATKQLIEIPEFLESAIYHQEHGLQFMIPSTPCSDHPMMFEITVEAELRCTLKILNQSKDQKLVVKKLELILQDDPEIPFEADNPTALSLLPQQRSPIIWLPTHVFQTPGRRIKTRNPRLFKTNSMYLEVTMLIDVAPGRLVPPSSLMAAMKKAYTQRFFSDFTLRCEDRTFKVHKFIVAQRSVELMRMSTDNLLKSTETAHSVTNITASTLEKIIRFIYTDDYDDSWPDVLELFEASVKFEVEDLEIRLEEDILRYLSKDTVGQIFKVARKCNAESLMDKVAAFVYANVDIIESLQVELSQEELYALLVRFAKIKKDA